MRVDRQHSLLVRRRTWLILGAALLFLPPLALAFQLTGDLTFCGKWCPRMFFVWRKGMTADAYLMGLLRSHMGVVLVLSILLTTFLFGRYWCSHLCPVGGIVELGSRLIPRFLKINYSHMPAAPFRYGYLTVYLLAAATGVGSLSCSYCNFGTVPRLLGASVSPADAAYFLRTAGLISLGLVVGLGFLSRGGRAYCNLICPIGAFDAIANRLGARLGKRVAVATSKCHGCGECKDACPTWAIAVEEGKATIDQLSCIPCRICEKTCPAEAISYGKTDA